MRSLLVAGIMCTACSANSQLAADAVAPDAPSPSGPGVVMTDRGAVRGVHEGDVIAWRGIPYAAPPVGDLRFAAPSPMPAWMGVRDAAGWSSPCVEISTANLLIGGSEDCLYLNVWAPANATTSLPVLLFVHGGFSLYGAASEVAGGERIYDGAYVAAHGPAIVVTLNYRLGAFGLFAADTVHGNFALQDQIAALRWVHDNIAAFGGDPAHVLLFGESAGGTATCALYASPRAAGLFSAAMIESGGCGALPAATATTNGLSLIHGAGCDGAPDVLDCLRSKSADTIATAAPLDLTQGATKWAISVDGDVVPMPPLATIQAGHHNHVPLIVGNTSNEYSTLIGHYLTTPLTSDVDYRAAIARFFPQAPAAVLARYPSASYASPQQALITALSDAFMICPGRRIARAATAAQSEPVRRYLFAHTYESGSQQALGAGHALDLPFELHNLGLAGFTPSAAELALSDAIVGYWVRFAATGDPNADGAPPWPRYATTTDPAIILDDTITSINGVRTAQCDFWDP